jgi:hypothetical protein
MRIRTALATSAALVALAACGGNRDASATADSAATAAGTAADSAANRVGAAATGDTGAMAPGAAAGTNASLADPSTAAQLDSVNTAAKAGLTSLAPKAAVALIRSLEDKLDNSNDPALTDIAKDLEKLREELDEGTIDTHDVGEIFRRLGPKVTTAAGKGGAAGSTLRSIGAEITKAGASAAFK